MQTVVGGLAPGCVRENVLVASALPLAAERAVTVTLPFSGEVLVFAGTEYETVCVPLATPVGDVIEIQVEPVLLTLQYWSAAAVTTNDPVAADAEERFVEALHRNREHPLDDGQCRRFPEGRKMEERTDGRKAGIATTDLVMPFVFQIVEESQYQRYIEVSKRELFGRFAQMTLGKPQQQAKAVAVGGNRLWADIPLLN